MPKKMNHAEYQIALTKKTGDELAFIAKDAQEAAQAMPNGVNAGYYADEAHYCLQELRRRQVLAREDDGPKMRKIMIVKKTDLTGTSIKHIDIPAESLFGDLVYMEVTPELLKRRIAEYWGK